MMHEFMGQAGHVAAFVPPSSLNEVVETNDGTDALELIALVPDPRSAHDGGWFSADQRLDARVFVSRLPERLFEIAYQYFWLDRSQTEIAVRLGVTESAVSQSLSKVYRLGRAHFGSPTN